MIWLPIFMLQAMISPPLSLPPPPVPPPIAQQTADCVNPTYASDMTVCRDEDLKALDLELRAALSAPGSPAAAWGEDQGDWFGRSRMCARSAAQKACLTAAYRERIDVLAALASPSAKAPTWRAARCGRNAVQMAEMSPQVVLLRWPDKTLAATTAAASDDWTPFARIERNGRKFTVTGADGLKLKCTENAAAKR